MFEGFTPFDIKVSPEITIHGTSGGSGPPLLLLHGFPQTHHIWHAIAPSLSSSFTIIALDLRGYGASSKPPSSPSHASYAKSAMASDCVSVMTHLGFEKFLVLAHDRGARVAHKLCVDYPEKVQKCMLLDICPTLSMYEQTNQAFATAYWHWFFLIQPHPFPERVILGTPEVFSAAFLGGPQYSGGKGFWNEEAKAVYVKQLSDEATVTGMCEDYRAGSTVDLEEARKDLGEGRRVRCELRVLWGKKGVIERDFDAVKEWEAVCDGVVSGESVDTGHYIAEEVPDVLLKHVKDFFG
jgi:haloacetate dehalogenase